MKIKLIIALCLLVQISFAQTPATIDLGLLNGKAKTLAKPDYPETARKANISGTVRINVTVNEQGNVTKAEAVSGEMLLRDAALVASRATKFEPYIVKSKAVKFTGFLVFNFDAYQAGVKDVSEALETMSKEQVNLFKLIDKTPDAKTLMQTVDDDELKKGQALFDKGDYNGAIKIFTGLIDKNSAVVSDAYAQRARAYFSLKKIDEALADAEKSLSLNPKNVEALNVRGMVSQFRQQFDAAIKNYTQAILLEPKFIKAYLNRGNSYLAKNDPTSAGADFRKVLEIIPNFEPARQALEKIAAIENDNQAKTSANGTADIKAKFSGGTQSALRKKFLNLMDQFNSLKNVADAKNKVFSPNLDKETDRQIRNLDRSGQQTAEDRAITVAYCKSLLDLDTANSDVQKIVEALKEMDKNGEAAQAASAQELAEMRKEIEKWDLDKLLHRGYSEINVKDCKANPTAEEYTLDDISNQIKNAKRNRIIEIMVKLGNLSDYFSAAKKFAGLTDATPKAEICKVTSDFEIEFDDIEPLLGEFFKLYIPEPDPTWGGPGEDERTVTFDDPRFTKQAEKLLVFRTKGFLPAKAEIKKMQTKYGCQ